MFIYLFRVLRHYLVHISSQNQSPFLLSLTSNLDTYRYFDKSVKESLTPADQTMFRNSSPTELGG